MMHTTKQLIPLYVICWSLITITARADDVEFLPSLEPTRTVFKLPAEVRRLKPRAAQTLELKIFRIGDNHNDVLLHLYADSGEYSPTAHLDLFLWRDKHFVRIQSFQVRRVKKYRQSPPPSTPSYHIPFRIHNLQWLNLKKKTRPIIALFTPNDTGYNEGEILFFIFADGMAKPPKQQSFNYYDFWNSFQIPQLMSVKGQDIVHLCDFYEHTQGEPEDFGRSETLYEWTGKQFTLIPSPTNHSQ